MELSDGFHQQRAVAEALCALDAAREDDDIEITIGHLDQRRIRQQFDAARADDGQAAVAGDAGGGYLHSAADQQVDSGDRFGLSSLPWARQISADALIFILLTLDQFK